MKKALFLLVGTFAFAYQSANAQVLFTTSDDFTGWATGSAGTGTPTTSYSYDSSAINGMGNNPGNSGGSINPGATTSSGSLTLTWTPAGVPTNQFGTLAFSPGEAYNTFFMHTIDPGSLGAFTAESGFGAGTTVSYSGTITMAYSIPDNEGGSYFQLGLDLAYDGDGYFSEFFPSSTVDTGTTDSSGNEVWLATIPYTINGGTLFGFGMGILYNSDYSPVLSFAVDDIQVVPEPTTFALAGISTVAGMLFMRRRKS